MTEVEDLHAKVRLVLSENGDKFESVFPGARERLVQAVAPAYDALWAARDRFAEAEVVARRKALPQPDGYGVAWHLLWDATNGLLAAFVLLQRGYETESLAVTRGVLERVACAIVLFDNPSLVPKFTADELPHFATQAIGPAGKVVTALAKRWGLLSRYGSHISVANVGTSNVGITQEGESSALHMAIGGKIEVADPEHRKGWEAFIDELCWIAEKLLVESPAQIFFNDKRTRATFK